MSVGNCLLTLEQTQSIFAASPPSIQKEIKDMSFRMPNLWVDLPRYETWDLGEGNTKVVLEMMGSLPPVEQGFDQWKKIDPSVGCDPCQTEGCGYNLTKLKGYGINQQVINPMSRELITDAFCIKDIQTTLQYKEFFAQLIANMQRQITVMKEYNVVFNYMTQIAKKIVVDSGGIKANKENPYVYPTIGTTQLSALSPQILNKIYQTFVRLPGIEPLAWQDNRPMFGVAASDEIFNTMYLDNPKLEQQLRFSGYSNDIINKYNFVSSIQGNFIPVAFPYPRRFNIVNGEAYVVPPWVNNIPANYGDFSGLNPAYEAATHEGVLVFAQNPITVYVRPTETDLGEGATFGPEPSYFDYWQWVNPQTPEDPLRRMGYFISAATIGLGSSSSPGLYELMVERPRASSLAFFFPAPECPPEIVDCDNEIPAVTSCPCPLIESVVFDEIGASYLISLYAPIDVDPDDEIQFAVSTGGYIVGTVVDLSSSGKTVEVTFENGEDPTACQLIGLFCDSSLGCSATVTQYDPSCTDGTRIGLFLSNPLKADTASDVVTLYYGDGTTQSATVVSVDMLTNLWLVDIGGTAFCDNVDGVVKVCVPPATDASCPACDETLLQCS